MVAVHPDVWAIARALAGCALLAPRSNESRQKPESPHTSGDAGDQIDARPGSSPGSQAMPPDLSVVILCYRTGESARRFVREVVATLDDEVGHWEIVLVGNYLENDAEDITPHVVRELAARDPRIKAVAEVKRGMMGWDVRQGLAAASGKAIAFIDGDGQMPADDLVRVYKTLRAGDFDMVKTFRAERHDGLARRVNSLAYNLIYRALFPGFRVRDVNSKPKIFTREFLERLTLSSDDWFLDAEIMIQARRLHCRLREIPTTFRDLEDRESFVRPGHIIEFVRNLAAARVKEFFAR